MERDYVKIKLPRETTLEKLDVYEFKMALFENDNPEKFMLFVQNFKMALEAQ